MTQKKKQPRKISPDYLRNSGLFYLQRYTASSHHFRVVMQRKINRSIAVHTSLDKEECFKWLEDIISEFLEYGYLNDEAYLKAMLQSLRTSRGLSTKMIVMKLRQKGFKETEIMEALSLLPSESDDNREAEWQAALTFAKRKKLGPYHPDPPRKTPEQQLAAFARAGFPYEIGKKLVFGANDLEISE
jgi:regulatory protein